MRMIGRPESRHSDFLKPRPLTYRPKAPSVE